MQLSGALPNLFFLAPLGLEPGTPERPPAPTLPSLAAFLAQSGLPPISDGASSIFLRSGDAIVAEAALALHGLQSTPRLKAQQPALAELGPPPTPTGSMSESTVSSPERQEPSPRAGRPPKLSSVSQPTARFECRVPGCFRSYRYKSDLKEHTIKKHSGVIEATQISPARSTKDGKAHGCPLAWCPCGFQRLKDLKRHIRIKHPAENTDLRRQLALAAAARGLQESLSSDGEQMDVS